MLRKKVIFYLTLVREQTDVNIVLPSFDRYKENFEKCGFKVEDISTTIPFTEQELMEVCL